LDPCPENLGHLKVRKERIARGWSLDELSRQLT
jgi:hypothetical protein